MALEKHTGARALRAILEEYMLDIMHEIPKDDSIGEVIITKKSILSIRWSENFIKRTGDAYAGSK